MTLFNWLKQRNAPAADSGHGGAHASSPASHSDGHADGSKKCERSMHRELLYAIVRECMANAGVVSAGYRFKVLSLDSRGHRFLVMVDLAPASAGELAQPAKVEDSIARIASTRCGIRVMGVYWRTHERHGQPAQAEAHEAHDAHEPHGAAAAAAGHASGAPNAAHPARGGIAAARTFDGLLTQGPQSYTLLTGFEDTETAMGAGRGGPLLSDTQPGEWSR